jgi:hypothetical protein
MLLYLSLLLLSNLLENFVPVGSSGVGPCLQAGDQVPLRLKIKGKLLKELRPIFSQTFPWSKCQWWDWNPRSEEYERAVDYCAGALTLIITKLSIVTFSRTTFSIVTFSIVTFSTMTFRHSIATFSIVTFSIATFSIVTFSIRALSIKD